MGIRSKTVVIIDDDSDDLEIMKTAFAKVDSTLLCISFIYADEAIRLLSRELILLPDYIFIDINMPRLNGLECLAQLRKLAELQHTPIIMYSTSMPEHESKKLLMAGASFTFQKPDVFNDYISILEAIVFNAGYHKFIRTST